MDSYKKKNVSVERRIPKIFFGIIRALIVRIKFYLTKKVDLLKFALNSNEVNLCLWPIDHLIQRSIILNFFLKIN